MPASDEGISEDQYEAELRKFGLKRTERMAGRQRYYLDGDDPLLVLDAAAQTPMQRAETIKRFRLIRTV